LYSIVTIINIQIVWYCNVINIHIVQDNTQYCSPGSKLPPSSASNSGSPPTPAAAAAAAAASESAAPAAAAAASPSESESPGAARPACSMEQPAAASS
jgi:hypothetical protein